MPRFTIEQYAATIAKPGYRPAHVVPLAPELPNPIFEHDVGPQSVVADENERGGCNRFEVRFERRGTKLLDKDNLYGGVKWACDALRYAGLIQEDSPESIELIVTQTRVKTRKECGTLITITKIS